MGSWWVESYSEGNWNNIGPVLVALGAVLLLLMGQVITTHISADILENCSPDSLKESAKNIWTNIGVTAALMLTLVAAMLQADPIAAVGFTAFDDEPGLLVDLQQTYAAACVCSFLLNLLSMLACVVNLSYVEPLTPTDAIKFFLDRPDTLGDPITVLVVAALLMFVGLFLWTLGTYGLSNAIIAIVIGLVTWICVAIQWFVNGKFNPAALGPGGYQWTQEEPEAWPQTKAESGTKMVRLRHSKQIQSLLKKLGKAILDEENRTSQDKE